MKKLFLVFMLFFCFHQLKAQNIPNADFDSVYIGGIDRVWNWITSDGFIVHSWHQQDTVMPLPANQHFGPAPELFGNVWIDYATPYSGTSIRLKTHPTYYKTDGSVYETYLVNGENLVTGSDGYIDFKSCGSPFPYRPLNLYGYYKYDDTISFNPGRGRVEVLLKKYNSVTNSIDTIGYGSNDTTLYPTTTWTSFKIPIAYNSNATPDSIVVVFHASTHPLDDVSFYLDELSFDFSSGIEEQGNDEMLIFPNPVIDFIYIKTSKKAILNYTLWDSQGRKIKENEFIDRISVEDIISAFFILELNYYDGTNSFHKLLKQSH